MSSQQPSRRDALGLCLLTALTGPGLFLKTDSAAAASLDARSPATEEVTPVEMVLVAHGGAENLSKEVRSLERMYNVYVWTEDKLKGILTELKEGGNFDPDAVSTKISEISTEFSVARWLRIPRATAEEFGLRTDMAIAPNTNGVNVEVGQYGKVIGGTDSGKLLAQLEELSASVDGDLRSAARATNRPLAGGMLFRFNCKRLYMPMMMAGQEGNASPEAHQRVIMHLTGALAKTLEGKETVVKAVEVWDFKRCGQCTGAGCEQCTT